MPAPWEKYQGQGGDSQGTSGPWDRYKPAGATQAGGGAGAPPATTAPKEETFSGALAEKNDPYGAGFVSGNLNLGISGLAGLPVDTATNAINLVRAAQGFGANELFGRAPRGGADATAWMPPLIERPFGGSEQISDLMRRGGLIGPSATPESTGGRYAAAALQQIPSIALGKPTPQQLPRAVGTAITSGVAGEAGRDIGGDEYAGVAAMLPGARKMRQPSLGEEATLARQERDFGKAKQLGIPVPPRALKTDKPQQKIQDAINKDLRRTPGTEINQETLDQYRSLHAPDYMRVAEVPFPIQANDKFRKTILDMAVEERKLRSQMPNTFKDVGLQQVLSDFTKKQYDPSTAMATVRRLRESATNNLSSPSATDQTKTLGLYQRKLANAMEDLIGDNLKARGWNDLYEPWTQARERMAKSYDVQAALGPDGKVDPRMLAALEGDKPLTGQLKAIAQVSKAFPQAVKPTQEDDALFTKRVSPMAITHAEAASAHWLTRLSDPLTMSRPYQYLSVDPASRLSPEQQRMLRAIAAAQASERKDIPPPP